MSTHRVTIYRVEDGEWKFDHVLDVECDSLSKACGIANGYNEGSMRDPKWLFMAVGEPIGRELPAHLKQASPS